MKSKVVRGMCFSLTLWGQQPAARVPRPLAPELFGDCGQVETSVMLAAQGTSESAFYVGVFPSGGKSLYSSSLSEGSSPGTAAWLARYSPRTSPFALLYLVKGAHSFKCRDNQGHMWQSAGQEGDPLRLSDGKSQIWHFEMLPVRMAHVFVVTTESLDRVDGPALLAEVTERLGARYVFLYVRNDPWFLGYYLNTLGLVFTESFEPITHQDYLDTKTIVCSTGVGCRVDSSRY